MRIAITATGSDLSSSVDPRFGRAKHFVVVDTDTDATTVHDNTRNLNAAQGAGIQAAEAVARLGVTALVTGNVGPKAFRVLNAVHVAVYLCGVMSVGEALQAFKRGELREASAANVEGHWA
jgi:predicted Fe-Mo cluster-binding NifX family protein